MFIVSLVDNIDDVLAFKTERSHSCFDGVVQGCSSFLCRILLEFCWSFAGDFALFIFPKFIFSNYRKKIQRSRCGGFAVIIIRQNFNGFNRFRQNFYVSFDCTKEGVVFYAHC